MKALPLLACVMSVTAAAVSNAAAQDLTSPLRTPPSGATPVFLGGVPSGTKTDSVITISILDAMNRALEHNLGVVLANEDVDQIVEGIDAILVALPGGEPVIDIALAQEPRRPIIIASITGKLERRLRACDRGGRRPRGRAAARARADVARCCSPRRASIPSAGSRRTRAVPRPCCARSSRSSRIRIRAGSSRSRCSSACSSSSSSARSGSSTRCRSRCSPSTFRRHRRPPGIRGILRARAGNALIHTIRDIDIATQLDHERFLVLLPYTDLAGAAGARPARRSPRSRRAIRWSRPAARSRRASSVRSRARGRAGAQLREADEGRDAGARAGSQGRRRARGAAVRTSRA